MADRDLGVDVVAVVGAIAGDGRHCPLDLVGQGTDLGCARKAGVFQPVKVRSG